MGQYSAPVWRNQMGLGALLAASARNRAYSLQAMNQGIQGIGKAFQDYDTQKKEEHTTAALNLLSQAKDPEQIGQVMAEIGKSGVRLDSKELSAALQNKRSHLLTKDKYGYQKEQDILGHERDTRLDELNERKFQETRAENSFNRRAKIFGLNAEARKYNKSYAVTNLGEKPLSGFNGGQPGYGGGGGGGSVTGGGTSEMVSIPSGQQALRATAVDVGRGGMPTSSETPVNEEVVKKAVAVATDETAPPEAKQQAEQVLMETAVKAKNQQAAQEIEQRILGNGGTEQVEEVTQGPLTQEQMIEQNIMKLGRERGALTGQIQGEAPAEIKPTFQPGQTTGGTDADYVSPEDEAAAKVQVRAEAKAKIQADKEEVESLKLTPMKNHIEQVDREHKTGEFRLTDTTKKGAVEQAGIKLTSEIVQKYGSHVSGLNDVILGTIEEYGNVDTPKFKDTTDPKADIIPEGLTSARKLVGDKMAAMSRSINKAARDAKQYGIKIDKKELAKDLGMPSLEANAKELRGLYSDYHDAANKRKAAAIKDGKELRKFIKTNSDPDKVWKDRYADTDYSKKSLNTDIHNIKKLFPTYMKDVPNGLIADAINNVTNVENIELGKDNRLELIDDPRFKGSKTYPFVYDEVLKLARQANDQTNGGFMSDLYAVDRDTGGAEESDLNKEDRKPDSALSRTAGAIGTAMKYTPPMQTLKNMESISNFFTEGYEELQDPKTRARLIQQLRTGK